MTIVGNHANDKSIPKAGIGILNKFKINPKAINTANKVINPIDLKIFNGVKGKKNNKQRCLITAFLEVSCKPTWTLLALTIVLNFKYLQFLRNNN
ncbi:hypothetical protein UREOM_2950 [Ureaplasma sp. OM1]|uniref:Uncharacterized protein n=1 Tax=Ureaplasma ceti TaxID=3119530 RepID=A0ABP9UCW1_9BACT